MCQEQLQVPYSSLWRRECLSRKNYAVRQHMKCPSSASQHSECNEPAPHYPACLSDHKAGPARYVNINGPPLSLFRGGAQ